MFKINSILIIILIIIITIINSRESLIDDYLDEDRAYHQITTIEVDKTVFMKGSIKTAIKSVVGEKGINTIKKIVKG